jgi:DNA-binding Lrp family transcriptional regulator
MDKIDERIIEILQKDASTPLSKVAEQIGIPKPTVYLRFNKMKEAGIIKGFTVSLGTENEQPLKGAILKVKDYLLSGMGERTIANLGKELAQNPDIVFVARISKSSLLVLYKKEDFDFSIYKEVIGTEQIPIEIYKKS